MKKVQKPEVLCKSFFTTRIPTYSKIWYEGKWKWETAPKGIENKMARVSELLENNEVKCGYIDTVVKGVHEHIIFYKTKIVKNR